MWHVEGMSERKHANIVEGPDLHPALPSGAYFYWGGGPLIEFGPVDTRGRFTPVDVFNVYDHEAGRCEIADIYDWAYGIGDDDVARVLEWAERDWAA